MLSAPDNRDAGQNLSDNRAFAERSTTFHEVTDSDRLAHLEWIAHWLDDGFQIPSLHIRYGWDALVKLVPVIGDTLGLFASLYLFWAFRRFELARVTRMRMAVNIAIDYFVGMIPLIGTVFDVFWKPNVWNVELLRRHLSVTTWDQARRARRSDLCYVIVVGLIAVLILVLIGMGIYWLLAAIVHWLTQNV
ncbi:MAG TPA: DUF4112 domain-containing protein [Pirellulales bacterium]|jgi:hypothetical protein|nr:DUF4112 domain-containing protein [Pirellulales bacterium]